VDLQALQRIALHVAGVCSVENVLQKIAEGLAGMEGCALARLWLIAPGDVCDDCRLRPECPDRSRCLHLVASAGRSLAGPGRSWTGTAGRFRRFPLGVRKVGRVGATGQAELLPIGAAGSPWMADPEWAQRERLAVFAGQPLVFRDEVLGVLGLFFRRELSLDEFDWLRTFADQAAVAIANARIYDEVQELRQQLELERDYLREEIQGSKHPAGLIGESPPIEKLLQQIEMVAPTDATVLIQGESGTGKELVASAVHERSARSDGPLVRVNCASIPQELFESEFFGHAKGAFTGAATERAGRFQVAHGGTLFLDEVGEIPLELQGKLLRVLQEGTYSRVGEDRERSVDVRVIAATNRDLAKEVEAGRFREDLYYRLTVFPIEVVPLRERGDDVVLLASHFLRRADPRLALRARDAERLESYAWPGNVRELQNVIERSVILSRGGRLRLELDPGRARTAPAATRTAPAADGADGPEVLTDAEVQELARRNVEAALARSGGKVSGPGGAAELLGLRPNTLTSRMKAMGIRRGG